MISKPSSTANRALIRRPGTNQIRLISGRVASWAGNRSMMRYMGMIRVVNVLTLLSVLSGRCMLLYFNKRLAED